MLNKAAVVYVAVLAAFAFFIGLAFAAAHTVTGEVVLANPSAKTVMINAQGKEMTFRVVKEKAADRVVRHVFTGFLEEQDGTFNGAEQTARDLADLKPGDQVTVNYIEADGTLYAQSVTKN